MIVKTLFSIIHRFLNYNLIQKIIITISLNSILFVCQIFAQDSGKPLNGFAVNPKFGAAYPSTDNTGFGGGVEINMLRNQLMYSIDYLRFDEFSIMGPSPYEYINHVGLMFGKYKGSGFFRLQLQAGPGIIWGLKRESSSGTKFGTVGLAAKLGLKIVPLRFFSFGIDLQTNINTSYSVYMPMISFEIGNLRNKM